MTVGTVAGTVISVSAAAPATFNSAGYAALTWAAIGEITDAGSHGRKYATVTHKPIDSRGTQKLKGSFDEGETVLQLAMNDVDPGQVILKAALNSDADYSFMMEFSTGAIHYFQAKVMSFETSTGSSDSMLAGSVSLSLTTTKAGVGIIEVAAP